MGYVTFRPSKVVPVPVLEPLLPLHRAQQAAVEPLSVDDIAAKRAAAHAVYRGAVVPLYGPPADDVEISEIAIALADGTQISARLYRPQVGGPLPVYVYLHGGAFWLGEAELFDVPSGHLAAGAGCAVVSVNYRLAPEHPFPTPVRDCHEAVLWVHANAGQLGLDPDRLAIGGASAGAGLAAAVTQLLRAEGGPKVRLQILEVPAVDLRPATLTQVADDGERLAVDGLEQAASLYVRPPADVSDPLASPALADDLRDLPPALIMTAEYDPLRAGGEAYAFGLAEAGVPVDHRMWPGQLHGSQNFAALIPDEALAYRSIVVAALVEALQSPKVEVDL